jgi:hypothetical protein
VSIYNVKNFPKAIPQTQVKGKGGGEEEERERSIPQIKFYDYRTGWKLFVQT